MMHRWYPTQRSSTMPPTPVPLFHATYEHLRALCPTLRPASAGRLALLVTGIIAARSCVLAQVASALDVLALTAATQTESIERRLRRTLSDPRLDPVTCYQPLIAHLI